MSKIRIFFSFILLIVIMQMTNADKEDDGNAIQWEYRCTELGKPVSSNFSFFVTMINFFYAFNLC